MSHQKKRSEKGRAPLAVLSFKSLGPNLEHYQECLEKKTQKWEAKASKWGRETNPWTTRTGANLLRRTKKKLLRSNLEEMFPKGKAPATAATCEGQESAAAAAG